MHIRRRNDSDNPDINFIPLIDVLLVIVIFLAVATTFTQERVLEVLLPQAQSESETPDALVLTITADGQVALDERLLPEVTLEAIAVELAARAQGQDLAVVIRADANASHQSVITAMQAVRRAGLQKLSFAAQIAD